MQKLSSHIQSTNHSMFYTMAAGQLAKTFFAFIFGMVHCSEKIGRDHGFGNDYVWASSLESGLQIATNHRKPVMVIIHKSWCHACKNLKPKFANSPEIQTLSKHFVMVNLLDEEEPKNGIFAPDGSYIPRILFISPKGLVDPEIYNEDGSSQHKYFYSKPEQIAKSMKKMLEKYITALYDIKASSTIKIRHDFHVLLYEKYLTDYKFAEIVSMKALNGDSIQPNDKDEI